MFRIKLKFFTVPIKCMEYSAFDLAGKAFMFDLDITMPLSKKEDFLKKYESKSRGWDKEKGNSFTFCPGTMGLKTAQRFCNGLPDYASISKIEVYPSRHPDAQRIYSGPLIVPEEKIEPFLDKRLGTLERKMKELSKDIKKIMETPVPLSFALELMKSKN
jgi:hypothetical protein